MYEYDDYEYDDYDDQGPLDSPPGDSESDHVWADLARSEQEPPPDGYDKCPESPDGHHSFATPQSDSCQYCGW